MEGYKVLIEGYDADAITNRIVDKIISTMDLVKLKNEVRNKIVQELKGDILNSKEVMQAIQSSFDKVDKIASGRVNEAVTKKIEEINNINVGSFKLTIE
jgi:putative cell wall-binding protein